MLKWSFRFLLFSLLVLTIVGYLLFMQQDRVINQVFRPLIVDFLENSLGVEVSMGSLRIAKGTIQVENLSLSSKGEYEFTATKINLPLAKEAFLRRDFSNVYIGSPNLIIYQAKESVSPKEAEPLSLPFTIGNLELTNGSLTYSTEGIHYRFLNITHKGSIGPTGLFETTFHIGKSEGPPVQLKGSFELKDSPTLSLHEMVLFDQFKLADPVEVQLDSEGLNFAAKITAENFDSKNLQTLLSALPVFFTELETIDFDIQKPELNISSRSGLFNFLLNTKLLELNYEDNASWLKDLTVEATQRTEDWNVALSSSASQLAQNDLKIDFTDLEIKATELGGEWSLEADSRRSTVYFQDYSFAINDLVANFSDSAERKTFNLVGGASQAQLETDTFAIEKLNFEASHLLNTWNIKGALELGDYFSDDGLAAVTGGLAEINGEFQFLDNSSVKTDLNIFVGVQELLYNSLYAELKGQGAKLHVLGKYNLLTENFIAENIKFSVINLGEGDFSGTLGDSSKLKGNFLIPEVEKTFQTYVVSTFSESIPGIEEIILQGSLGSNINLTLDDSTWGVSGFLSPKNMSSTYPFIDFNVKDLNGSIPFAVNSKTPEAGSDSAENLSIDKGQLTHEGLKLGVAQLARGEILLEADLNSLIITSPLVFHIADGIFSINRIESRLAATGFELKTQAHLAGIQLESLTKELELPLMKGEISGDLGEIIYTTRTIQSGGEISINVFEGQILMSDLAYQDPFSAYSKLAADIKLEGINLYELTQTFAFGEINGILDGEIRGLELLGMTPVQFTAQFETRDRGSRNISVKALSNIGIMAQGAMMGALQQGIYKFIDFYRYRKIAFNSSLSNDVFFINGTALRGSNDYLIYGGIIPPKINMVAPQRAIPFNEMLSRMQRIQRTSD